MSEINEIINLNFHKIQSEDDVEILRQIRNSCADFMTNYTKQITQEEQKAWWKSLDKTFFSLFLLSINNKPVGYGVIKEQDGKSWLTGGIVPEYRDRKLGKVLFAFMMTLSQKEIWLEVLKDNIRAQRLYKSLSFKEQYQTDKAIVMKYEN